MSLGNSLFYDIFKSRLKGRLFCFRDATMLCLWISWRFVETERAPSEVKILIFRVLDDARTVSTLHPVAERSRSAEWMVAFFCSLSAM